MKHPNLHFDLRQCLECGKELKGRVDKKYCDQACKSAYHNRNKNLGEETLQHINRILRRNRSILKTLCPQGKATVRKNVLDEMGYDYIHFTSLYKSQKYLYYLVYDYGFAPIMDTKNVKKVIIVQRQQYMNQLGFPVWRNQA